MPLEQLLNTPGYQSDKTVTAGTSAIVYFMSLIRKIGFEKYPKVRDAFDDAWGTILAESDFRIVLHIASAAKKDFKQFLVLMNDTDAVMYNLAYFHVFTTLNVYKIWVKFGIHKCQRHTSSPVSRDLRNRKITNFA